MKSTATIISIRTKMQLPAHVLEEIVNHRTQKTRYHYPVTGIDRDLYSQDFDTVLTYSIQSLVKGNLFIEFSKNRWSKVETIIVPVASSFLVTCIKAKENKYKMEFSSSLN